METALNDRMESIERKRGRPPSSAIRHPIQPVIPAPVQVPGIRCLGCARGVIPYVNKGTALNGYLTCPQCGCRMHRDGDSIRRL